MKAKINGVYVEGTFEEIWKMLGITVVGLRTDENRANIEEELREGFASQANDIIQGSTCKSCPHQGEGCNPQFCL